MCIRDSKTGIEKALAVRHGIEKVFYSRDMITVRFRCSRASDGKDGRSENLPAAERNETPPLSSSALKSERPVSDLESGPSLKLERMQKVEHIAWPPTVDIFFANTGHSYWANYRLTGDYNLRPS